MTDFSMQRAQMLERQLRTVGVLDTAVLSAFANLPREDFVPETYLALAYADHAIPLNHGQALLKPGEQALMLQALALKPGDSVLEVGIGSGYLTALLAQLAHKVTAVDFYEDTLLAAKQRLSMIHNVSFVCADYSQGPKGTPVTYDAILINGAVPTLATRFYEVLKPHGRLVAIVGAAPMMQAILIQQVAGVWQQQVLFETLTPLLAPASAVSAFHF